MESDRRMAMLVARLIHNELRSTLVEMSLDHILVEADEFYRMTAIGPFMESVISECQKDGTSVEDVKAVKSLMQAHIDAMTG